MWVKNEEDKEKANYNTVPVAECIDIDLACLYVPGSS